MTLRELLDLDRTIARVIFGETWADDLIFDVGPGTEHWRCTGYRGPQRPEPRVNDRLPRYSSDMNMAWRVVHTLKEWPVGLAVDEVRVRFFENGNIRVELCFEGVEHTASVMETAARAICQAALAWAARYPRP